MIVKELYFGEDSRKKLESGIKKISRAVKSTLGPSGRPVVIESENHVGGLTVTKDGVTVANSINLMDPTENLAVQMVRQAAQNTATQAGDGPQPLYANVLTPTGWRKMGDISKGDVVCGSNGTYQDVVEVYEKGDLEVYEVVFADGRVVECSSNHLWSVSKYGKGAVITTEEMAKKLYNTNRKVDRCFIYYVKNERAEMLEMITAIDPFLLGLLLGDGSLSGTGAIELSLGIAKKHLIDLIKLPDGMYLSTRLDEKKNYYRVKINGCTSDGKYMKDLLNDLGLLGVNSKTKFIPPSYLYSSIAVREALLNGLIATDGHINTRGLFEFSTVSDTLADDMQTLICSLGMSFNRRLHSRDRDKGSYSDTPIHRIAQLQGYKFGYKIVEIRKTGKVVPMRCIKVSNDDHLYFTDGFIMTHNTSTSVVLTEALIDEANKHMTDDNNVTNVCRHIVGISEQIDKRLIKMSKPTKGKTLYDVATISANNDPSLGRLIADTYSKASFVTAENSMDWSTYADVALGIKVSRGFSNRAFINDHRSQQCVLTDAYVLITDYEITSLAHMEPVLKFVLENNKSLLIIGQLNVQTMGTILTNVLAGKLKVCNIVPPDMGIRKDELLDDLAIALGGKYISGRNGDNLQIITEDCLGHASRIVVSADGTVITPGNRHNDKTVAEHIDALNGLFDTTKNNNEREFIKQRIANISGSIGVIYVGGNSDIEQKEKKDRVDDAVLAVRAALEEGILPGAGQALIDAFKYVIQPDAMKTHDKDYATAYNIMMHALYHPFSQILINGGKDPLKISGEIADKGKIGYGYDSKNERFGDLIKMGVIDPAKVTRSALKNSVSVATTIIMSDAAITNIRDYASTK